MTVKDVVASGIAIFAERIDGVVISTITQAEGTAVTGEDTKNTGA